MPKITALIHVANDAARLGRTLESLRPCDELLLIDHGSSDDTARIGREYGARVRRAIPGVDDGAYAADAHHDWVLCLLPSEALTEALEASLFEWKQSDPGEQCAFRLSLREQLADGGWQALPPQVRLVDRRRLNWTACLPPDDASVGCLTGDLVRFQEP